MPVPEPPPASAIHEGGGLVVVACPGSPSPATASYSQRRAE
jgi:hypothetical protein